MKGTNEFRFNEATMIETMQEYLDKRTVGIAPRVQSVRVIHDPDLRNRARTRANAMSHWLRVPIFSLPPVNNSNCKTLEAEIEFQESIGWDFVTLIPGQDHGVAELRKAPQALFRESNR